MNKPNSAFTVGEQPCQDFKPRLAGNNYAQWDNRHQCYRCGDLVSFCLSCSKDHHAEGYAACRATKLTCNMHSDCEEADAKAKAKGFRAEHCRDECCSDCFGN